MDKFTQRVIENIRHEIKRHLRTGEPMPERDPRWNELKEKLMKEEEELLRKEQEAKYMIEYETTRGNLERVYKTTKDGLSYDEWLAKIEQLYSIDDWYVVRSVARGPDNEREWICKSYWQAKKKVMQLIYWRYYDHFMRDITYNMAYDPDEEDNGKEEEQDN